MSFVKIAVHIVLIAVHHLGCSLLLLFPPPTHTVHALQSGLVLAVWRRHFSARDGPRHQLPLQPHELARLLAVFPGQRRVLVPGPRHQLRVVGALRGGSGPRGHGLPERHGRGVPGDRLLLGLLLLLLWRAAVSRQHRQRSLASFSGRPAPRACHARHDPAVGRRFSGKAF